MFSFVLPILLPYIVQFLMSAPKGDMLNLFPDTTPAPDWWGYVYLVVVVLAGIMGSVFFYHSLLTSWIFGLRLRTALVTLIYRKALKISPSKTQSSGAVVNLMSTDAQLFMDTFVFFIQGFVAPIQIIVVIILLWLQIGPFSLISLVVLFLSVPFTAYFGKKTGDYRFLIQGITDNRVKLVKELILAIRIVKYYAWERPFKRNIEESRKLEIKEYRALHIARALMMLFLLNVPPLGIGFTFFFYGLKNTLSTSVVFTSLSLLNVLRMPFVFLPVMLSIGTQYAVSLDRIMNFALRDELPPLPISKGKKNSGLSIKDGDFSWESIVEAKERAFEEHTEGMSEKEKSKVDKESLEFDQKVFLRNINLEVKKGELVMVVGSVGSGKTSLALAFLGEMHKTKGELSVNSPIAYVAQEAWIINATVRDNILFGRPYDKKRYDDVIRACSLISDFKLFKAGDLTEIGERGTNLSGGQRQRINVARAMYSDRDIYIFDDPFSAVDAHVGKHMFHNVVETLKNRGKSILLLTNQLQYLPYSDKVALIKDGRIKENGTFKELMKNGKGLAKLANEYGVTDTKAEAGKKSKREKVDDEEKGDGQLVEAEASESGNITFSTYLYYIKAGGVWVFSWVIIFSVLKTTARVASSVWLSRWSDPKTSTQFSHEVYVGGYMGMVLAEAFLNLVTSLLFVTFILQSAHYLHKKLTDAITRAPTSFYDTTPIGRLLSRFSKDINLVDMLLPQQMENLINMFFNYLSVLAGVAVGAPYIVAVIVVAMVFYIIVLMYFRKASIQVQRFEALSRGPLFSHFSETLEGIATIRSYQLEDAFRTSNLDVLDRNTIDFLTLRIATQWFGFRLDMLGHVITLGTFLIITLLRNYGSLDTGLAALALSYTSGITLTLSGFSTTFAELDIRMNSVERLREYDGLEQEAPEYIPETAPPEDWPRTGSIEFKKLVVEYVKDVPVLNKISAKIKPREKIGIVGRTGAGKSTLITTLFRTTEASSGKVLIDGVDIGKIGLYDLRSKISIIPQISQMFMGTLRYNLDPFDHYEDKDLWRVLEMVGLKKYVKKLDGKLLAVVEENGQNFSVGQRQLIAMARCLLRDTNILLLDEATAAVDVETDATLQKMIRVNFKDKTVLTIAHRLNTVMDCDRIMVLDKGQIVEFDKPITLLENKQGYLYSMVEATGPSTAKFLRSIAEGKMTVAEAILEESSEQQKEEEEKKREFLESLSGEAETDDEDEIHDDSTDDKSSGDDSTSKGDSSETDESTGKSTSSEEDTTSSE